MFNSKVIYITMFCLFLFGFCIFLKEYYDYNKVKYFNCTLTEFNVIGTYTNGSKRSKTFLVLEHNNKQFYYYDNNFIPRELPKKINLYVYNNYDKFIYANSQIELNKKCTK